MESRSWIQEVADKVEAFHKAHHGDRAHIVCASGISPSGPIHLGNLREVMTVHFVADELRLRGRSVDHIHSWDDFDRLRKVPVGVPESYEENIGRPLSEIPDPAGEYPSYADRHIRQFQASLDQLGVRPRYIRQAAAYRSGRYVPQIKRAMEARQEISRELAKYQTKEEDDGDREAYYPFRIYCESCHRDSTRIQSYDTASASIQYACKICRHEAAFSLDERVPGKLVWKVDWPMRWQYEGVDFEPGGEDHSTPGSSYTVGKSLVQAVYGGVAPYYIGYGFVGAAGRTKLSSSLGSGIVPEVALRILEPPIIRWLYCRREPRQKFNIDFGQEVLRLYDEWDSLARRVAQGTAPALDPVLYQRSIETADGPVGSTPRAVSFRLLSSLADVTLGNTDEMLRVVANDQGYTGDAATLREDLEPRFSCAIRWSSEFLPQDERTIINPAFQAETYAGLSDLDRRGIHLLLEQMDDAWSLEGLTSLLYGIPKQLLGLPLDIKPTDELKQTQRRFFIALYQMLCSSDTGPRLPTLLLALKQGRVRTLLTPTDMLQA